MTPNDYHPDDTSGVCRNRVPEGRTGDSTADGAIPTRGDVPDTDVDLTTGRTFEEPFAFDWMVFDTSGRRQLVKFDRETLDVLASSSGNLRTYWFVRR
jgi:hypothetical protein